MALLQVDPDAPPVDTEEDGAAVTLDQLGPRREWGPHTEGHGQDDDSAPVE